MVQWRSIAATTSSGRSILGLERSADAGTELLLGDIDEVFGLLAGTVLTGISQTALDAPGTWSLIACSDISILDRLLGTI